MEYEFKYPAMFKLMGVLIIGLISFVWLVLIFASVKSAGSISAVNFIVLSALCAGFIIFGVWMIRIFSGIIELDSEGITQRKGSKAITLSFERIFSVTHENRLFQALVLKGPEGELSINKNLIDYPKLWEELNSRIPLLRKTIQPETIQFKCKVVEAYFCFGIFAVISIGFIGTALFAFITKQIGLGLLTFISAILGPFAGFLIYFMLTYPKNYVFKSNEIVSNSLVGTNTYNTNRITKAAYGQRRVGKGTRYSSRISNFVEFNFEDKNKFLNIDNSTTDFPIEYIVEYVNRKYGLGERFIKVSLDDEKAGTK